jgi:TonB family protein
MARFLINAAVLLLFSDKLALFGQVRLDQAAAERLLLERPAPVYPQLAERARINEPIILLITVSETGAVNDVKVISGNPLLNQNAIESARGSKYKPYTVGGKAASFSALVEIRFVPTFSQKDYDRDQQLANQFFEQEDKCRDLLNASDWQRAEETCRSNLSIADKLGAHRGRMKMRAYQMTGQSMLSQNKYKDALGYLNRALRIGKSSLRDNDADLGDVHVMLGLTYSKMGKLDTAMDFYTKGEKALQLAYDSMRDSSLKTLYLSQLKKALEYHIEAAKAAGDDKRLEALKKQLALLP